jgi:hypothetical protein
MSGDRFCALERTLEVSMKLGRWFGWTLAGGFSAVVSCGGGGSSGLPGFGTACTSDTACESYDLVCGDGKCVQCLDDSDCKGSDVCSAGKCAPEQECSDSRDCGGSQVCDEKLQVCVDCVTSDDCKSGQACQSHQCHDRPPCDYTSDCSDGLLCDAHAHICVSCRTDDDCGYKRICVDYECEPEPKGGNGGSGGKGSGGSANGGRQNGGSDSGGSGSGGHGGATGGGGNGGMSGGGSGGASGNSGTAGTAGDGSCGCALGDVCTPDDRCVPETLIDDLVDCNNQILAIEGRSGNWTAEADKGINLMYGFSKPGSGWADNQTCAAWATGGEISVNNPDTTFAFIGFELNAGEVYDLRGHLGIQIQLESSNTVQVVVKTLGGGYFEAQLPSTVGSNPRKAAFASMTKMNNSAEDLPIKLNTVTEIQFSVTTPKSFGLAVHRVELY